MYRRGRSRGSPKFEASESSETAPNLPALDGTLLEVKIAEGMAPAAAMEHYKSRLYLLVRKLRDYKRSNPKLTRYDNDWWFPIVSKDSQFTSHFSGSSKKNRDEKVLSPDFASNLELTIQDFDILKNASNGRWKKAKQLGFPICIRKDQAIDWILLDEHEEEK